MTDMLRPVEFAIALRYLRSKSKNRFVSFISLVSVAGIALAVAVLITVLSAMNGFEHEVRNRILGVLGHGTITGLEGRLIDWRELSRIAAGYPGSFRNAKSPASGRVAKRKDSVVPTSTIAFVHQTPMQQRKMPTSVKSPVTA